MLKYIFFWLPLPVLGFLNGMLREFLYKDRLGELAAHQLSTFILIVLLFGYGCLIRHRLPLGTLSEALIGGIVWMLLTVAIEFGLGLLVNIPMRELLNNYHLGEGRIWILVPLFMLFLPLILRRV